MIHSREALEWMERNGVTKDQVAAVIRKPKHLSLHEDGIAVALGGGLQVMFVPTTDVVLHVSRSVTGAAPERKAKGKRGKGGTRWPTSWSEMRRRILALGLIIETGATHDKVRHPDTGEVLGILPQGERRSRGGYAAHADLGKALLAAGYDTRNQT